MNPFEKIALSFLKKELASNPALISKLVQHILEQSHVDPAVVGPIVEAITELVPFLVTLIP